MAGRPRAGREREDAQKDCLEDPSRIVATQAEKSNDVSDKQQRELKRLGNGRGYRPGR